MKKKILTKHILMALAMAAMVPAGQAWAADIALDGNINLVSGEYTTNGSSEENLKDIKDKAVIITKTPLENSERDFAMVIPMGPYSGITWDKDFYVTVTNSEGAENADGLHIMGAAGEDAAVTIGDFSGVIHAANSDGISIVNEAGGSNTLIAGSIGQNGGLTVDHGNGIRASAVSDKYVSGTGYQSAINVVGATNITINGETITAEKNFSSNSGNEGVSLPTGVEQVIISGGYSPAAVYAGDDMHYITSDLISSQLISSELTQENIPLFQLVGLDTDALKGIFNNAFNLAVGAESVGSGNITLNGATNLVIEADSGTDASKQGGYGLYAGKNGSILVNGDLRITSKAANSYGIAARNANLIYGDMFKTQLTVTDEFTNNLKGKADDLIQNLVPWYLIDTAKKFADGYVDKVVNQITSEEGMDFTNLDASQNHGTSVELGDGTDVSISMQGDNSYAMYAEGVDNNGTQVSISGEKLNTLYAEGDMLVENGGLIKLETTGEKADDNGNSWGACQLGAVIASGTNKVSDTDIKKSTYSLSSAKANYILSESVIADAGDLNTSGDSDMSNKQVISALYAENGADIEISSGQSNTFLTTANPTNPDQLERVIWAYNGADITVGGTTTISTDSYEKSANSNDIAIAAGTAVGISAGTDFNTQVDRAEVNLNYGAGSAITGDILAGYAGEVNIDRQGTAGDAGIKIEGNLLAGNNGILNVDLGNGGVLEGRADDYGDAGVIQGSEHTKFFDPAFSSDIYKGGAVNLTMGKGSRWNVTGQSWITQIDTTEAGSAEDSGRAVIDLVSANTDRNETAHALTISEMKGDAVFNMSLDGNRDVSDMLYMKNASGDYIINVVDPVTTDDMYAGNFHGLRFATVGTGSDVSFRAVTIGQGLMNVEYTVKTDPYEGNDKNEDYNSTEEDGTSGNTEKPGDAMVDGFFDQTGESGDAGSEAGSSAGQYIMLMAQNTRENSDTEKQENEQPDSVKETTNYKLTGIDTARVSNAGQTVLALSRVNYSNAVYMDRLNKRMGEARYIDGDDGLWVRLRHDRIGKEDAFRTMNTMFELGYDWKVQDQKNGEHRRGVAFDYMRGEADYTNVMGSGDVRRAGVWLYDMWLGDKGHYSDYVVKYGRLSNDFDIFNELGTKVSGDYDNDVWSASVEYGRKKDIGSEWYFEPQAQLQYAYVTSADYTTSQNTKVELDGIDSLIGRAGFRLGRDTSEGNTVYFKADILHEFLGDQSIHALDKTGELSTTYENEGTWYDVGFGFSHRMGEDSYMFLDVEHSFGNDNEDTYQINIGLNRAF